MVHLFSGAAQCKLVAWGMYSTADRRNDKDLDSLPPQKPELDRGSFALGGKEREWQTFCLWFAFWSVRLCLLDIASLVVGVVVIVVMLMLIDGDDDDDDVRDAVKVDSAIRREDEKRECNKKNGEEDDI